MDDKVSVRTFTVTIPAAIMLIGCTQLDQGDVDQRNVDIRMYSNGVECVVEVVGSNTQTVTDDTVELKNPGG